MTTFTIHDIRSWGACYDPEKYLPRTWQGTALDILSVDTCPPKDRIWVVLRVHVIPPEALSEYITWVCTRAREHLKEETFKTSLDSELIKVLKGGKGTYDQYDLVFDSTDRIEQIGKLKSLLKGG